MKKWYAAGCVALTVAVLVVGQTLAQDMEEEKGGGGMPAWMNKAPAHAQLAKSVGTFDVATEFWMGPGEPQKGVGTAKREMILNGLWLQETFQMNFDGMAFEGRLTSGYDTVRGKLVNTWTDNMSPVMGVQYGMEKDGALVFTGEDPGPDGKLRKVKSVITFEGADKWVMTAYWIKPDGGESIHMRLTYTRRK